ncbi:restriction endonuclease subunit S [Macrococcoides caseolyticum]|uniref:restriction endonuclease subunit S n=1 Tax=Macrococcoides caseolyticum TaxID=69966 RepID=UPI002A23D6DA|nr:restriction endonuclease subunit S [Macrococcus caseolyticus]
MTNKNEQRKVPELRFPEFSGEWEEKELNEIASFYKGKGISKRDISEEGVNCILYGELYTKYGYQINEIYSHTDLDEKSLFEGLKNDVLIPSSGETAIDIATASNLNINNVYLGGDINVIRPIKEYNGHFISLSINGKNKKELSKLAQGKTVVHLYNNEIKKLKINIPSISEQQKIGEFFSKLDRQIELEEKKLALLEEQKKGYMQKIFSQELRFKDENGEEYPEWEEVVFSKLFKSKIEKNNDLEFDKNKIISVAKMQYKEDNNKDSSNEYMKTYNKMRLNDIAFEGNKSKDYRYGRFVLNDIGDGIVSHVFIVFSPIMDFESSFMKYYINYEPIMGRKLLFATTSTLMMTSLKTNEFMNLSIRLPGINEQRKIGLFISTFNKKIETQNMKVSLLINMKKQLLNKMMI